MHADCHRSVSLVRPAPKVSLRSRRGDCHNDAQFPVKPPAGRPSLPLVCRRRLLWVICRLSGLAAKFYGEVGIQAQATSKRVFLLCQRPEGATQPIPGGAPGGLWHVCLPGPHALPAGARGVRTWEQAASWRRSNTPATIRRRPAGGRAASAGNRRCARGGPTAARVAGGGRARGVSQTGAQEDRHIGEKAALRRRAAAPGDGGGTAPRPPAAVGAQPSAPRSASVQTPAGPQRPVATDLRHVGPSPGDFQRRRWRGLEKSHFLSFPHFHT